MRNTSCFGFSRGWNPTLCYRFCYIPLQESCHLLTSISWKFGFFCRGSNYKLIAKLKYVALHWCQNKIYAPKWNMYNCITSLFAYQLFLSPGYFFFQPCSWSCFFEKLKMSSPGDGKSSNPSDSNQPFSSLEVSSKFLCGGMRCKRYCGGAFFQLGEKFSNATPPPERNKALMLHLT